MKKPDCYYYGGGYCDKAVPFTPCEFNGCVAYTDHKPMTLAERKEERLCKKENKKMKAEDLMVGDWVKTVCPKQESYQRVKDIHFSSYPYIITAGDEEKWFLVEVEPIPLTPEILEKNGFEKLGYDGWEYKLKKDNKLMYSVLWRCDYPNALRISSYSIVYGDFNSFHIDNVHELQHALKLCNIDLEIKL